MTARPRRIALDAMGSDRGSAALVRGAIQAVKDGPHHIILVGNEKRLTRLLKVKDFSPSRDGRISVAPADEIVSMTESPSVAIRKKNSSIRVAAKLVRSGEADGLVSAGNTGATMATTKILWRSLEGVSRPAIAQVIPSQTHPCVLLDVGANVDCKPLHLHHFAVMGSVYAQRILRRRRPKVGLLNIGEEASKGNAQTAAAYALLEDSNLNFIGNVEGFDVLNGRCDVVVCDGFVGNIVLKFGEALAGHILTHLKGRLTSNLAISLASLAMRPTFRSFKREMDPDEFGGAPLLGVNGVCIICHGATNSKAVKNAIRVAAEFAEYAVNDQIVREIADHSAASSSTKPARGRKHPAQSVLQESP